MANLPGTQAVSAQTLLAQLQAFMRTEVLPVEERYRQQLRAASSGHAPPLLAELKAKARALGLWNLFLPGAHGAGLSNLDYAPLAECMGRVEWASEVFNCSAPDTGNMEVLALYGTPEQQARWLQPLLDGEIRSAFSMTEPAVASSDATNIQCRITRDGDEYVINGRKWYSSGAMNAACQLLIVMGKTSPDHPDRHRQQSMILVPRDTPGVTVVRDMRAFGYDHAPGGHPEIVFDNVRVPAANLLLGEGRGFEIAQGRLGPGRIHHCMRLIGCAQRALELMCQRASSRMAFGKPLAELGSVREDIARSHCEIEQARLLTLAAADKMDREGNKAARDLIAAAKIVVPHMAATVIDRAIQLHGAAGVSQDTFLAEAYVYARFIRIGDGPDQVHLAALGKQLLKQFGTAEPHGSQGRHRMKAVLCKQFGPPEALVVEDLPTPEPGPGQVRVAVHAAAANFPDTLIIENKYQFKPPLPFAPGGEVAGTVDAVGEGVTAFQPGDRVIAACGWGGFAEALVVDAGKLTALPEGIAMDAAASLLVTYGTTHYALRERAHLQPGETLLVLGAAGGTGLSAIELGKHMGARVIAAASSDEKLAVCRQMGADETINYTSEDLRAGIKRLTGDTGVDVVYDPVGGAYTEAALRGMAWNGRYLVIGFTTGEIPRPPLNLALLKGCAIVGVFYGAFNARQPARSAELTRELLGWLRDGTIRPHIALRLPLEQGAQALRLLADRKATGKVVLSTALGRQHGVAA